MGKRVKITEKNVTTSRSMIVGEAPEVAAAKRHERWMASQGRKVPESSRMYLTPRDRAFAIQRHVALTADAVMEQIARGALFDPREMFYAEDGVETYRMDGPEVPNPKYGTDPIEPRMVLAWRKGDVKRMWSAGDLKPMHELTEAQAQAVLGVEVVMKNATAGDGMIDRVLKVRWAPREKYVELAARAHGMLVDRVEASVSVEIGSRLDAARARAAAAGIAPSGTVSAAALRDIPAVAVPEVPKGLPAGGDEDA